MPTPLPNQVLLDAIRLRGDDKDTPWSEGILTADKYVSNLVHCTGSDLCYRYAAKGQISFSDVMKKAASTLTYHNPDMLLEKKAGADVEMDGQLADFERPKNTLMMFKHVLTSSRKDRDNDILRTSGARPDPKMLLLWNHVHTLPIGKVLGVANHTAKSLSMITAIVDVNELAHDAAVMIDNDMGRFSHGFRALDVEAMKAEPGTTSGKASGFDVKTFEIMEASLVTVPSNVDAVVEDVMLSLVEGRKLKSPLLQAMGQSIRTAKNVAIRVGFDEEACSGNKTGTKCSCGCGGTGKTPCAQGAKPTSAKTDDDPIGDKGIESNEGVKCPECGSEMKDGKCGKCGYTSTKKDADAENEKAGRVVSSLNRTKLVKVQECLTELGEKELLMSRGGKSMCKEAHGLVTEILDSSGSSVETTRDSITATKAMSIFLAQATDEEQEKMAKALEAFASIAAMKSFTKNVEELI